MLVVNGCDHPAAGVQAPQASLAALDDVRRRLEEQLRNAAERLRRIDDTADLEPSVRRQTALDVIDEVQANETREALFASRERLLTRIQRLRAALARLGAGSYGQCLECGAAITAARLRALPDATTCVGCQGRHERAVALARPSPYRSSEGVQAGVLLAEATAAPPEATLPGADASRPEHAGDSTDNARRPRAAARSGARGAPDPQAIGRTASPPHASVRGARAPRRGRAVLEATPRRQRQRQMSGQDRRIARSACM